MCCYSGIGPNYVTAMERSLTAAPKVYGALIIHLASTVNQEIRSQWAAAPKPHDFLVGKKNHFVLLLCCPLWSLSKLKWFARLVCQQANTYTQNCVWCFADGYVIWYLSHVPSHWHISVYSCANVYNCFMIKDVFSKCTHLLCLKCFIEECNIQ